MIASGNDSPAGFDVVQESGSIQSLPGKNLKGNNIGSSRKKSCCA